MINYNVLFHKDFPIIGCIHLLPLPGAPDYGGDMKEIIDRAVNEAEQLCKYPVDGLIIENFGDAPFYPDSVPAITIASMTRAVLEIKRKVSVPLGVNVLRNDAVAAISIANATGAEFVRINIHMHAMVTDQGIIQGKSYDSLRLKKDLGAHTMIFADINVKHAHSLVEPDLKQWTHDLVDRGGVDAIIVTGSGTGKQINIQELNMVKDHSEVPVLVGSGTTPTNVREIAGTADGAIVGSYFKLDGKVTNPLSEMRLKTFFDTNFRI